MNKARDSFPVTKKGFRTDSGIAGVEQPCEWLLDYAALASQPIQTLEILSMKSGKLLGSAHNHVLIFHRCAKISLWVAAFQVTIYYLSLFPLSPLIALVHTSLEGGKFHHRKGKQATVM